jgi:hypothetical protein
MEVAAETISIADTTTGFTALVMAVCRNQPQSGGQNCLVQ